jgi:hypothetical protein
MTTVLSYQQRAGRFGREVRGADVPADDTRSTMEKDGASESIGIANYVVDPDAVAAAIVERLLAGRTMAVAPRKQR